MKIRDLIKDALSIVGVLGEGENPTASQASDGLFALRNMLRGWSTNGLLIPSYTREVFPLTAGKAQYTIGPGCDFDTIRPMTIEAAKASDLNTIQTELTPYIPADPGDPLAEPPVPPTDEVPATYATSYESVYEMPVSLLNIQEWSCITDKKMQSTYVSKLYVEGTNPQSIQVWPVPSVQSALVLYSQKQITDFDSINDDVDFPPGYEEPIIYNLAARLCIKYGRSLPAEAIAIANESLTQLQRQNTQPVLAVSDAHLMTNRGRLNIYTGEYE